MVIHNPEPREALLGFPCHHGTPIVVDERPRQPTLLKRLAQPVAQFLRPFAQVPLRVAAQSRTIVQGAQEQGIRPLAVLQQDPQGTVVEVQVPQPVDVFGLEAAHFPVFKTPLRHLRSRTMRRSATRPLKEAVGLHEARNAGVGRAPAKRWLLLRRRGQIVRVQLVAPTRMLPELVV